MSKISKCVSWNWHENWSEMSKSRWLLCMKIKHFFLFCFAINNGNKSERNQEVLCTGRLRKTHTLRRAWMHVNQLLCSNVFKSVLNLFKELLNIIFWIRDIPLLKWSRWNGIFVWCSCTPLAIWLNDCLFGHNHSYWREW